MLVLHRLVAECELAKVKGRYISVPSKQDVALLLDDIHRYGLRLIIGTILLLSAVRYRASDGWKKVELSTLIRLFLWLLTASNQESSPLDEQVMELVIADEALALFSQEEPDEPTY